MATSLDSLLSLANLAGAIKGSSQTQTDSGGTTTETTQKTVDQAGIDRTVQRLTSGQGGQAAISGAARGAGLYNSTSEQLMLNDLNARIAGEVANITAPTTTTRETSPSVTTIEQPGVGLSGVLTPLLAASALKAPLSSLLGLDGGGAASLANPLMQGARATTDLFNLGTTAAGSIASSVPSLDSLVAGPALASSLGQTVGQGVAPGILSNLSNIPVLGPLLGGITNGFMNDQFGANLGLGGMGAMLAPLTGGISALAAPVMGVLTSLFSGGLSVVCTALRDRGLLDAKEYEAGSAYLRTLSPYTVRGYYYWGKPLAARIAKGNSLATKIALPWATQRTKLLAGTAPAWKLPLGLLTKYVGEPACFVLGYVLSLKDKEISNGNQLISAYCSNRTGRC